MARQRAQRQRIRISLTATEEDGEALRASLIRLREIIAQHPGASPVVLNIHEPEGTHDVLLSEAFTVEYSSQLEQQVTAVLGEGSIRAESTA
jgi:hypothetical protein